MILGTRVPIRGVRAGRKSRELADAAAPDRQTNCYVPKGPLAEEPTSRGVRALLAMRAHPPVPITTREEKEGQTLTRNNQKGAWP